MVDFSKIASSYENKSLVQKSAGQLLLNLLEIKESDDVLDLIFSSLNASLLVSQIL